MKNNVISFLYDISKELRKVDQIESSVQPILSHISDYLNISCCAITIFKQNSANIILEEVYGLDNSEKKKLIENLRKVKPRILDSASQCYYLS
jgi:nitrate/nitrite-specific signal transduction histidine kinase